MVVTLVCLDALLVWSCRAVGHELLMPPQSVSALDLLFYESLQTSWFCFSSSRFVKSGDCGKASK